MTSLKEEILKLNIYKTNTDGDQNYRDRSGIIATRAYLFILILTLIILTLVVSLSTRVITVTLAKPTRHQLDELSFDAYCPCSHVSISYGTFISFSVRFHKVCSSDFVSDRWIKTIFSGNNSTYFYLYDFRISSSAQFQALAGFCRLSEMIVRQQTTAFDLDTFFSAQLMSEHVLRSEVKSSIDRFRSVVYNTFQAQIQQIRNWITSNQLVSGLQTNLILQYFVTDEDQHLVVVIFVSYKFKDESRCSCFRQSDCHAPAAIYDLFDATTQLDIDNNTRILMIIPGLRIGCMPVTSILFSSLECFYNQACLNDLSSYFSATDNFTALSSMEPTRFANNATVKSLVDELMIEEWTTNISYDYYYGQCAPVSCTYFKVERRDFVFVLTKLLGLLSGLTVGLRLIISILIKYILRPRGPPIPCKYSNITIHFKVGKHYRNHLTLNK